MRSKGYILPVVIILSGIASSILAIDLHRFRAQTQLQSLESQKKSMLLVLESESLFFLEQLETQLNQSCELTLQSESLDCQLPSIQSHLESGVLPGSMTVALAYKPCEAVYGLACIEQFSNVFGVITVSVQGPAPQASLVDMVRYERHGYVTRVAIDNTANLYKLGRTQLVDSL